jgi:hypothetical protein
VTLMVEARDLTPPTIASVAALGRTTVRVMFSEPVEELSAEDATHYTVNNGVVVLGAVRETDPRVVTLTTAPLASGTYTLTINNVTDETLPPTPPNPVAPDSQAAFAFTANPRVLSGLVALYGFEEGSGTTVNDVSGTGTPMNLTILNPASVQWIGGGTNGIRFANPDSAVRTPGAASKLHTALTASNRLTLEAWVTPASLSQSGPARIATLSSGTASSQVDVHLGQEGGSATYRLRTSDTGSDYSQISRPSVFLNTNTPRHLVVTYDGSAQRLYLDGVQQGAALALSGDFSVWNTNYPFLLGNEASLDRSWLGSIHLAAIYNRALSQAEVQRNYSGGALLNTAPVAPSLFVSTPENTATNLLLPGSDAESTNLVYALLAPPANGVVSNLGTNTGALTYSPAVNFVGLDLLAYTVNDGYLLSTGYVTVTVTAGNSAPTVLNPVGPQTGTYGAAFNLQFPPDTFEDGNGDPLTYSAFGLPAGLLLNGPARTFSGTPVESGVFTIGLVATDDGTPALRSTNLFTLTVDPATLAVSGLSVGSKTYDGTVLATLLASGSLSGVVGGDDVTLNTNSLTVSFAVPDAGTNRTVNVTGLALSGADATNYTLVAPVVTADILPASLVISANDTNKLAGQSDPVFTARYSGLVAGETEAVLSGSPTITREPGEAPGTYILTPSGWAAANYSITYETGLLTILDYAPTLVSLTGAGTTNTVITWTSVSNLIYRVRYRPSLSSGNWVDLVPDVTATNATASAVDNTSGVTQRFYQVVVP